MKDREPFTLTLTRRQGYQFAADFGADHEPGLVFDEPVPLGAGQGPNAARVLGAAVGNCLSASLLYCLQKARVPVSDFETIVEGELVRNEKGRMRMGPIRVKLAPAVEVDSSRLERCLALFEDFCVVTQSVREGIDVQVQVTPVAAARSA